jgi:hypothetical protein
MRLVGNEGRLRPVEGRLDVSWVLDALLPFEAFAVGSLVPAVFEAYGRILHPAHRRDGTAVRWESVAAWSGRTVHSLAEFALLAVPRQRLDGTAPFARPPDDGALPLASLDTLCEVLARHTMTPDACFMGVWEGFDWIVPWRGHTWRLSLPERTHLVFEGPLKAIDEVGWTSRDGRFIREAPSLFWPVDRAWFVSTDVDQDSTFLGGSQTLIETLIADRRLEVWSTAPMNPITAGVDLLNRG